MVLRFYDVLVLFVSNLAASLLTLPETNQKQHLFGIWKTIGAMPSTSEP